MPAPGESPDSVAFSPHCDVRVISRVGGDQLHARQDGRALRWRLQMNRIALTLVAAASGLALAGAAAAQTPTTAANPPSSPSSALPPSSATPSSEKATPPADASAT